MAKIFYDHLFIVSEVIVVLHAHQVPSKEREEILTLVDEAFHHNALNVILSLLPKMRHATFLEWFHKAPHDPSLLTYIKLHGGEDIEQKISSRLKAVKRDIIKQLAQAHTHSK